MKVLFNTYPMAFHTPGGGEIQLQQYRNYLIKEGVDVKLFDLWNPKILEHDILHFFSCISGSLHFTRFVKNLGIPVLISPNLWITHDTKENYACEEIRTQLIESDRVICNSDAECDLLSDVLEIPREKFKTVYNGVEEYFLERVSPELFRNHFGIHEPFILNVANIEKRKNQLQLIKAMKKFPEIKLVFIGHKRDESYAQECFNEGGSQVIYIGPLAHGSDLLRSAYAACEAFALPSTLETPGLAALEAAASGARIVITQEGSTSEYFGKDAFYIDAFDENSIAQGIQQALMATKGNLVEYVRNNFTWTIVLKKLIQIYEKHNLFGSSNIKISGFNSPEYNGDEMFVWSKHYAELECKSEGRLTFEWRAVDKAHVDVLINDVLVEKNILVCSDWTAFLIEVKLDKQENCKIEFIVKPLTLVELEDPRELGVALTNIHFKASTDEFKR